MFFENGDIVKILKNRILENNLLPDQSVIVKTDLGTYAKERGQLFIKWQQIKKIDQKKDDKKDDENQPLYKENSVTFKFK